MENEIIANEKIPFQRVYAVIMDEGKIILVRDRDDRNPQKILKFPGGGVECSLLLPNGKIAKRKMFRDEIPGAEIALEPVDKALAREVQEETGLIVEVGELVVRYIRELKKITTMARLSPKPYIKEYTETEELLFYEAKIIGNFTPQNGTEIAEIVKLSPAEIADAVKNGRLATYEDTGRNIYHTAAAHVFLAARPEIFK